MRALTHGLAIALIASASFVTRASLAQTSQADSIFFEARQLVADGKFAEACPLFEKSQAMRPGIGTLLNLADCYDKLGKPDVAYRTFRDARDAAKRAGDPRESIAATRLDTLKARVTIVAITIDPASDVAGLTIQFDGHAIERASLADLVVTRSAHKVEATAPGKSPFEIALDTNAETAATTIAFPIATTEPSTTPARSSPVRTIGIVVAGVGLASIVVGAFMGVASISNKGTGDQHCMLGASANQCDQTGVDARSSALTFGDFSTAFFVTGAVALTAGVVLFLVAPRSSVAARALAPLSGGLRF